MKRIISLILCVCLFLSTASGVVFAQENEVAVDDYAEVTVGEKMSTKNIVKAVFSPTENSFDLVKRGNRPAIQMNPSKGCHYMKLGLDDALFPKTPDGGSYAVTVDYFDEGTGFFSVRYDGIYNNIEGNAQDHNDIVRMENTKEWKSHTFYISDADFGGEWQNVDVIIALFSTVVRELSAESIIIGNVKIEKAFPQNPVVVDLTSAEIGNVFAVDDEKTLKWKLENVTEVSVDIKFDYTVFDEYANQYEGGSIEASLESGEVFEKEFTASFSETRPLGVYKIKAKGFANYVYKGEAGTRNFEGIYDYSLGDKFKPDEESNKKFLVATHIAEKKHDAEKNSIMAMEAGVGMLRDEVKWEEVELEKGVYTFDEEWSYPDTFAANGQTLFLTASMGNKFYTDSYTAEDWANDSPGTEGIPLSDTERTGFANYVIQTINRFGADTIPMVELWNEPNHQNFNPLNRTPEDYAGFVKHAYPLIKAAYPNVEIGACSTAALPFWWLERVFATGALDYMDAVTVHPYQWNGVFNHDLFKNDMKQLHELMEKYGGGDKPVWATEWGFSSGTNYWGLKTAANQMRAIVQFYTIACAYDYIDVFAYYNFQTKGVKRDDGEHNFGVIGYNLPQESLPVGDINEAPEFDVYTTQYAAKPAYLALMEMNKMIGNAESDKIYSTPEGIVAMGFKRTDGQKAVVLWSDKQREENISFSINGNAALYDIYGNKVMNLSDKVVHTTTIGNMPMWIKGNISDVKFCETTVAVSENKFTIAAGDSFDVAVTDAKGCNLTTKVIAHESFKTSGMAMNGGKGTIKFVSDDNTYLRTYDITLEHYDKDTLVAVNKIKVEVIDAISISLRGIRNASSLDKHIVEVEIENKSTQRSYSGICSIAQPSEFASLLNQGKFTSLRPGETITIPLNVPRIVQKKYHDVTVKVDVPGVKTFSATDSIRFESQLSRLQNSNVFPVYNTEKYGTPVIDGVATDEEWGTPTMVLDTEKSFVGLLEEEGWNGPDDLSVKVSILWDNENFYFRLTSKDDVHYQNYVETEMWKGDSIQFGIIEGEPDILKSTSYNEFGIAFYDDGVKVYRSAQYKEQPIGLLENVEAKATRSDGGITYEVAIPWIEVMYAGFVPKEGRSAAFNVILNDNDSGERKGWIELGPGIGSGKNATKFKCIDFVK